MMINLFQKHPETVGETYLEHRATAHGFAGRLMLASFACFIHGILPFVYIKTASGIVMNLNYRMGLGRRSNIQRSKGMDSCEPRFDPPILKRRSR